MKFHVQAQRCTDIHTVNGVATPVTFTRRVAVPVPPREVDVLARMEVVLQTVRDMASAEREVANDIEELDHARHSAGLAAFVLDNAIEVFTNVLGSASEKYKANGGAR